MLTHLLAGLIVMLLMLYQGFILKLLWLWYVVPAFGFAPLKLVVAIGLGMIVGLLTLQHIPRSEEDQVRAFLFELYTPSLILVFGWIFSHFV